VIVPSPTRGRAPQRAERLDEAAVERDLGLLTGHAVDLGDGLGRGRSGRAGLPAVVAAGGGGQRETAAMVMAASGRNM
jgi:hypothetical protein